jgi:type IV secretory pathway VirB4 component
MHNGFTYLSRITGATTTPVFGIWPEERSANLCALGKSGTGKSSFLEFLIRQDLANGNGLGLFVPHGDSCNEFIALHSVRAARMLST